MAVSTRASGGAWRFALCACVLAWMCAMVEGQSPSCPSSLLEVVSVLRGGVARPQELCTIDGQKYVFLTQVAGTSPSSCDEAQSLALPNVGCSKLHSLLTTFYGIALYINENGGVYANVSDFRFAVTSGASVPAIGYRPTLGSAYACHCGGGTPAWGSIDLRGTAFALSTTIQFQPYGSGPYNGMLTYSFDNQRAEFTADGCCGDMMYYNHLIGDFQYVGERSHPSQALMLLAGQVVMTPTSSPSSSATPSATITASMTPIANCVSSIRALPYTDIDGDPIMVLSNTTERDCLTACCRSQQLCSAYVISRVTGECFLMANSTSMVPSRHAHSGVRCRAQWVLPADWRWVMGFGYWPHFSAPRPLRL